MPWSCELEFELRMIRYEEAAQAYRVAAEESHGEFFREGGR
jgi:hypothetical protein